MALHEMHPLRVGVFRGDTGEINKRFGGASIASGKATRRSRGKRYPTGPSNQVAFYRGFLPLFLLYLGYGIHKESQCWITVYS